MQKTKDIIPTRNNFLHRIHRNDIKDHYAEPQTG